MKPTPSSSPALSAADIDAFATDGVVCLRNVFDSYWIDIVAAGIERNFDHPSNWGTQYTSDGAAGGFHDDYCSWERIEEYRQYAFHSPAARIAQQLLSSREIRFYHEHVLIKEPGTHQTTPWHHDLPYYGLEGNQLCSVWMPLDPVSKSICPEFIAGSHLSGTRYFPRLFANHEHYAQTAAGYEAMPDIEAERDRHRIVSWAMQPGDCLVFHMLTVHGAPGTTASTIRRRGFATRWLGDDVVLGVRPWTTSPPFENLAIKPGQPMHDPRFPVVLSAND